MLATEQQGYLYLNDGNIWAGFFLQDLVVDKTGACELTQTGGVFSPAGVFRSGPVNALPGPTGWFRVEASGNIPAGSHVQLFTFTADAGPPPFNPALEMPFSGWTAAPRDALQAVVVNPPAHTFWIGGGPSRGGASTPPGPPIPVDDSPPTFLWIAPPPSRRG